jgi:homoserine O-acetyltransferase/O-succinyltransferase
VNRATVLELPSHRLEGGAVLSPVRVAYRTWGRLAARGDNAVVVCHALTGSADADAWWPGLFGPGRALDPQDDFIVCANVLGGCYGSTGPTSTNPLTGLPWGDAYPEITVRDMVAVQRELLDALGVLRVKLVIGGSLGGMQALEWTLLDPDRVEAVVTIGASGRHSAWCIAISEAQRQAIAAAADPAAGLAVARQIAMISYRSRAALEERFGRAVEADGAWQVAEWLRRHGQRLVDRFDAHSYLTLGRAMDSHDVARGRGAYEDVLGGIRQRVLVIGIDSDVLYPVEEQRELARLIPRGRLEVLRSPHGHDSFLIDGEVLNAMVVAFRESLQSEEAAA